MKTPDENGSLSDYLFAWRRSAAPGRLRLALAGGTILGIAGVLLGPKFAVLAGLGAAMAGVCAWALVNRAADAELDGSFTAAPSVRSKRLRAAGSIALGVAGTGALVVMYAIVSRFLHGATGM